MGTRRICHRPQIEQATERVKELDVRAGSAVDGGLDETEWRRQAERAEALQRQVERLNEQTTARPIII